MLSYLDIRYLFWRDVLRAGRWRGHQRATAMDRRDVTVIVILTLMLALWIGDGMKRATSATARPALALFNRDADPRASIRQPESRSQLPSPPAYHCFKDTRVGMACYPY
jgi:hypothetical protein